MPEPKKKDEEQNSPPETQPGRFDDVKDLFEGEDENVVASVKVRILSAEAIERRRKNREAAAKKEEEEKKKTGKKPTKIW